mgnify:CR=1 FL=1
MPGEESFKLFGDDLIAADWRCDAGEKIAEQRIDLSGRSRIFEMRLQFDPVRVT